LLKKEGHWSLKPSQRPELGKKTRVRLGVGMVAWKREEEEEAYLAATAAATGEEGIEELAHKR
jgi:hypothetical protein